MPFFIPFPKPILLFMFIIFKLFNLYLFSSITILLLSVEPLLTIMTSKFIFFWQLEISSNNKGIFLDSL